MNKVTFIACLLCLAVPSLLRGQSDTTQTKKAAPAKAAKAQATTPAFPPEQRAAGDSSASYNRIEEYSTGTYDNNYQMDNKDLYLERDDSENKRATDAQSGQSDGSDGGSQE
jgi:hypothetical protein